MKIKLKIILFSTLLLFVSCKQSSKSDTDYNENRELVPNPEGLQKDNYEVAQTTNQDCKCVGNSFAGTKTDTIYQLSNGKRIALCGYRNTENKPIDFSEFVLSICGENKIIDFWDATVTCNLRTKKDTLIVEELINLPTKKNRIYTSTIWSVEKFYFENEQLKRKKFLNEKIRKYNNVEILLTLKEYENANDNLDDDKMELANRLFIATLSNNKKARDYFNNFGKKYKLDGAFSEEYSDLKAMLEYWDEQ